MRHPSRSWQNIHAGGPHIQGLEMIKREHLQLKHSPTCCSMFVSGRVLPPRQVLHQEPKDSLKTCTRFEGLSTILCIGVSRRGMPSRSL